MNQRQQQPNVKPPQAGFTLIELLLVMTIMVAGLAIVAPSLSNFFRGRTLDAEARRLLALSHSGKERAVSEGVPMLLWVDVQDGTYGLKADPSWGQNDPKAESFQLDKDLKMQVLKPQVVKPLSSRGQGATPQTASTRNSSSLPEIRFLPDGTVDDSSPAALRLEDRNGSPIFLAESANRMAYELRTDYAP